MARAPTCKNPIFAYGRLSRSHARRKNCEKKFQKKPSHRRWCRLPISPAAPAASRPRSYRRPPRFRRRPLPPPAVPAPVGHSRRRPPLLPSAAPVSGFGRDEPHCRRIRPLVVVVRVDAAATTCVVIAHSSSSLGSAAPSATCSRRLLLGRAACRLLLVPPPQPRRLPPAPGASSSAAPRGKRGRGLGEKV